MSKQFETFSKFWEDLSDRDRKILVFGIIATSVILFIKYALIPAMDWKEDLNSRLRIANLKIAKMNKSIKSRPELEAEINRLKKSRMKIEQNLFKAKDVDLASAEVIKTVRTLANSAGIVTSRISTNKSKETEALFQDVPLNIPSIRCDMKQLFNFLVNIKRSPKIFSMDELRIRVTNMNNPTEISVNMEISGYMLKASPEEAPAAQTGVKNGRTAQPPASDDELFKSKNTNSRNTREKNGHKEE